MPTIPDKTLHEWHSLFGDKSPGVIVRAPGRVNIIGEHTDYNEGWVMPGAINKYVYILLAQNDSTQHHWAAANLNESVWLDLEDIHLQDMPLWAKYLSGALHVFENQTPPLNLLIAGDLPVGAGISSSSALVCGMLTAIHHLLHKEIDSVEIANLARRVEREIIGLQGGIMDQFAIMLSHEHSVMMLDCRDLSYQYIDAHLPGTKWLLINTKVKHQLIDSDYNERANECKEAIILLQNHFPEIMSLRDVTLEMLHEAALPELLNRRANFVIEENQRVHEMALALKEKNTTRVADLLKKSHEGLQNQYEVSCEELDTLAIFANQYPGVYGARMMGGGFGGCVICLVKEERIESFLKEIMEVYHIKFNFYPERIDFELSNGVEIL